MTFYQKAEAIADVLQYGNRKALEEEYYTLSWSGKDPLRVIALAIALGRDMKHYAYLKHMTSSYYSQVKHLLKKGRLSSALFCLTASMHASKEMLRVAVYTPQEEKDPIDFEIAGAPYFLLQQIPLAGVLWKEKAIQFLITAEKELNKRLESDRPWPSPVSTAIIWSKLHLLTGDEKYKLHVHVSGISRSEDRNQLERIARHLKMDNVEELFKFCGV